MKKNKSMMIAFLVVMLTVLMVSQVYAGNNYGVDNFNVADQTVCAPVTTDCSVSSSAVYYDSAIGNYRTMIVTNVSALPVVGQSGVINDFASYSVAQFGEGTFEMNWDGNNNPNTIDYTGLNNEDLTQSGQNDRFYFSGIYNDVSFTLRFEVYTDETNWSYIDIPITGTNADISVSPLFIDFLIGGGSGASFDDVGALRLLAGSGVPSLDFSIDYVTADDEEGPTAISLETFSAESSNNLIVYVVGIVALIMVGSVTVILRRKQNNI